MTKQVLDNVAPADSLYAATNKVNDNFTELYANRVASVDGVTPNSANDIDLIAGANQTITPGTNSLTFAATDDGIGKKVESANPALDQYRFLTKLPVRASGNRDRLFIEVEGGPGWFSSDIVYDYIQLANYSYFNSIYEQTGPAAERSNVAIVAYLQADTSVDVYVRTPAGVWGSSIVRCFAKDIPVGSDYFVTPGAAGSTVPSGTVVFDSATSEPYNVRYTGPVISYGEIGAQQTVTTSYTITNTDASVKVIPLTTSGAVTSVALAAGIYHGQPLELINRSANTITFNTTTATSRIAASTVVIAANGGMRLRWDGSYPGGARWVRMN